MINPLRYEITELVRSDGKSYWDKTPKQMRGSHGYSPWPQEERGRVLEFNIIVLTELWGKE